MLIAHEGGPSLPKKNLQIGAVFAHKSSTLLLCVVSEQRGLQTACREAPLPEIFTWTPMSAWKLGHAGALKPSSDTCRSSEEPRCAKLCSATLVCMCVGCFGADKNH